MLSQLQDPQLNPAVICPVGTAFEAPRGDITMHNGLIDASRALYVYRTHSTLQVHGNEYLLRAAPGLVLPIEGFVGKTAGVRGVFTDESEDGDDMSDAIQIVEVHEFWNHHYPDSKILSDVAADARNRTSFVEAMWASDLGLFCAGCGGRLEMKIYPAQLEHFRGSICEACRTKAAITQKQFTQDELVAAFKQMQAERADDGNRAKRMLEWICAEAGISKHHGTTQEGGHGRVDRTSPYPVQYDIVLIHDGYGRPSLEGFMAKLAGHDWLTHVDGTMLGPVYEAKTPEGVYKIYFGSDPTGGY